MNKAQATKETGTKQEMRKEEQWKETEIKISASEQVTVTKRMFSQISPLI